MIEHFQKAEKLAQNKKLDSALVCAKKALSVASTEREREYLYRTAFLMGDIYQHKNDYVRSLEYYLQALQASKLAKRLDWQQQTYFSIGGLYSEWKIYAKAVEYYKLALSIKKQAVPESVLLKQVAFSYVYLEKYDESMTSFKKLIAIQSGSDKAKSLNIMATLLAKQKHHKDALLLKKQAYVIMSDSEISPQFLTEMGMLHVRLDDYDNARHFLNQALLLARENVDEQGTIKSYINLGLVAEKEKKYKESVSYFRKVVAIQKREGIPLELANSYNYLAKLSLEMGSVNKGKLYADTAFYWASKLPLSNTYQNTLELYTKIYKKKKKREYLAYYQTKLDNVTNNLLIREKENERIQKQRFQEVVNQEMQIQDVLRIQEVTTLERQVMAFRKEANARALTVLQQKEALKKLNYEKDLISQAKTKKDLLYAQKELETIKKAALIEKLQHEQEILKHEQELQRLEQERQEQFFKQQKEIDNLAIKNKETELKNSRQNLNIMILLSIAVLALLGFLIMIGVNSQKKKRLFLLQEKVKIESRLFRSQMNPHFLFNAMNSIQSFLMTEDAPSAHKYLAKFAQLMRLILDNSSQEFISLDQELETLKLYLSLERLRFDDSFSYEIVLPDTLDDEFIGLPPMLLQPFVENAILHGLTAKEGDGLLKIAFEERGDFLHCIIQDNGVGRKKAEEFKKMRSKKHESRATVLTEKRLQIFDTQYHKKASIQVVDLYNDQGDAAGTKVEMVLPIIEV